MLQSSIINYSSAGAIRIKKTMSINILYTMVATKKKERDYLLPRKINRSWNSKYFPNYKSVFFNVSSTIKTVITTLFGCLIPYYYYYVFGIASRVKRLMSFSVFKSFTGCVIYYYELLYVNILHFFDLENLP